MFVTRKKYNEVVRELEVERSAKIYEYRPPAHAPTETRREPVQPLVTCNRCGCAVILEDAERGESVIVPVRRVGVGVSILVLERIKKTYYCKKCAKKEAKRGKSIK